MDSLNCITLNVRGLRNKKKRECLFAYLENKNIDIACIQETYCTADFQNVFSLNWKGKIYHSYTTSVHSRGVCILISDKVDFKLIDIHCDRDGRKLMVNIQIDDNYFTVMSIYCPNKGNERSAFLKQLVKWTSDKCISRESMICGGDFNCTLDKVDRKNKNNCDQSSKFLKKFMSNFDLYDVWRKTHSNKIAFTFIDPSGRGYDSRIDYLFISESIFRHSHLCYIIPAPVPDHNAVFLKVSFHENKRGPGYWKMNVSVLEDENYVSGINLLIDDTISDYMYVDVGYISYYGSCVKLELRNIP